MTLLDTFSKNLLQARWRKDLSQRDVADKAGISISYVSMLERAQRSPPLDMVETLAKALGVTPLSLLEESRSRHRR